LSGKDDEIQISLHYFDFIEMEIFINFTDTKELVGANENFQKARKPKN
jgi:hypothetical protein